MNLESDKRHKAQPELDLSPRGEARKAGRREVESRSVRMSPKAPPIRVESWKKYVSVKT
jgi:hypothetical protein